MLNAADIPTTPLPKVIEYTDPGVAEKMAAGKMNTEADVVLANITSSIRRGHSQMRQGPMRPERICLVGSGPSLNDTVDELRDLLWQGAVLVTLNGSYHWCLERNFRPQTQVVMDARASNARFVSPYVPRCNYLLASQCAPELWDAVADYTDVWIWHALVRGDGDASQALDAFYRGQWMGVGGGTTVATRALFLLRMAGYVRFDLFGIDCCWMGGQHHALPQPENARDRATRAIYGVPDVPDSQREFRVTAWQLKQFEDILTLLALNGAHLKLAVHGDGLLAYAIRTLGSDSRAGILEQE